MRRFDGADINARGFQGEELARLHGFREIDDCGVVGKEEWSGGVEDYAVAFVDADLVAGVVEEQRLEGVFGFTGIVDDGGGEEFGEYHAAVGRPAEGIDDVTERPVAAAVFLAFEQAAALAVGILEPDVIMLEVVFLGFEIAMDGEGDAAIGGIGEGGDVFVDVQ
jgi:hypothetical protein